MDGLWDGAEDYSGGYHYIFSRSRWDSLDGYKSVDRDSIDLMRAMGATKLQIFLACEDSGGHCRSFLRDSKISASYAVVGAVISEWLGGFVGLGVYMTRVKQAYAFDKMFAVIIFIVVISLLLMAVVNVIRRVSMPWMAVEEKRRER